MHCIDMNAWYSRVDKPDRPDFVLFDLDPPEEPDGFALGGARRASDPRRARGARPAVVREDERRRRHPRARADRAPLRLRRDLRVRRAALAAARGASTRAMLTTEWLKKKRAGVLVDHRQNGHGKTIASVYSVRPKPGAPVSTPLRWDELTEDIRPRDFSMAVALERVARLGDLFEPVLAGRAGARAGPTRVAPTLVARVAGDDRRRERQSALRSDGGLCDAYDERCGAHGSRRSTARERDARGGASERSEVRRLDHRHAAIADKLDDVRVDLLGAPVVASDRTRGRSTRRDTSSARSTTPRSSSAGGTPR